jgi:hypothetical protein
VAKARRRTKKRKSSGASKSSGPFTDNRSQVDSEFTRLASEEEKRLKKGESEFLHGSAKEQLRSPKYHI